MEIIWLSLSAFWGFGLWSLLAWLFGGAVIGLTLSGRTRGAVMTAGASVVTAIAIFAIVFWRWDTAEYASDADKAIEGQAFGWIGFALIGAYIWLAVIEAVLLFLRRRKILGEKNP